MRRLIVGSAVVAAVALVPVPDAAGQGRDPGVVTGWNVARGLESSAAIGVSVRDPNREEIAEAGLAEPGGARVEAVRPGTPAAAAGMQAGDVVVALDGERVRSARAFARLVQETPAGRAVTLAISRAGERLSIEVTPEAGDARFRMLPGISQSVTRSLESLPRAFRFDADLPRAVIITSSGRLGATLLPLDNQLADYFGVTDGVLVSSVTAETPAARAGLRAGDVISGIGGTGVTTVNDVNRAVRQAAAGAALELRVTRDRKEITMTATLP